MIRNNNQNGRRRGRGVRPPQAGGGPSGNYSNTNRVDVRQRGNATQLLEKYKAMARDATQNGDRVQAEFYMQYADHYYRVLNEFRARDPQPAPRQNYDDEDGYEASQVGQNYAPPQAGVYTDDGDDDEGDDDTARQPQAAVERNSYDRQNSDRQGGERQQVERQGGDRQQIDRQNNDRQAYDRNRGNGEGSRPQPQQRAYNGQRETYAQRDGNTQRDQNSQREGNAPRDTSASRDGNVQREAAGREAANREVNNRDAAPRVYRDDASGNGDARNNDGRVNSDARANGDARAERPARPVYATRRDGGNAAAREPSRGEASREAPADPMPLLAGLPGPATLTVAPPVDATPLVSASIDTVVPQPVIVPAEGDAEAPAPRRRGRPRKVAATVEDAVDS